MKAKHGEKESAMTTKQRFIKALHRLPDDATVQEIVEQICVTAESKQVRRAKASAPAGKESGGLGDVVTVEDLRKIVKDWPAPVKPTSTTKKRRQRTSTAARK